MKAELIKERESFFSEKKIEEIRSICFPRFIMMRMPAGQRQQKEVEWQGFVKTIKSTLMKHKKSNDLQLTQIKDQLAQ